MTPLLGLVSDTQSMSYHSSFIFGKSALGQSLIAQRWRQGNKKVFILGGVHGDEPEGIAAAIELQSRLLTSNPLRLDLTLLPIFNPDGALKFQRVNGNAVDLNRNLPTKDWSPDSKGPRYYPGPRAQSEPESTAMVNFLDTEKPDLIISLHSWNPILNVNGDCLVVAQRLSQLTGYGIDADIGYPTPGCLGTYAGLERKSPVITYEIERGLSLDKVIQIHPTAILEALKIVEAP